MSNLLHNREYKTFWDKFSDILRSEGSLTLPNVKEVMDPQEALDAIHKASTSLTPDIKVYKFRVQNFAEPKEFHPGNFQTHETCYYPKFFLNGRGMGGSFDGSGAFICRPSGRTFENGARVFTFAYCEHDWDDSGANHSRGWHPLVCKKCGFDASIDSGD